MKIMKLKKYKDNNYKRKSYVILVIGFLLLSISSFLFYKSYAFYEEKKNFDVINGTVEDPGDIYFAYYIDGVISRNMPLQNTGYTLDETKSNCNNGVVPTWDNAGWKFIGDYHNYSATDNTRTKCTLYFNKTAKTVKTTLGNIEVNSYTPDFTKSACADTSCESHEKGIFETTDTDGNPTYYYRGSVENNYVKFAGFYWRIIRINSNGSIRMIYDGTSAHKNGESSTDRQYGTSSFNENADNNMYVGYMYTQGVIHGTGTSSTIKIANDKFYIAEIAKFSSYIDTSSGFCGDRSLLTTNNNTGIEKNYTIYSAYDRVLKSMPSLKCKDISDYYTVANSSFGNKSLSYAVGVVNVDEVIFSGYSGGLVNGGSTTVSSNEDSYLNIKQNFTTMTPIGYFQPAFWGGNYAMVFYIEGGRINNLDPQSYYKYALRPVINIRSDVTITGSGIKTDPYVVNG